MRDQRGFTLVELLVGIIAFLVLLSAILAMTTVATHNQDRIAKRVAANQRLRPVMTRLIDTLRSSCVAPRVAPVAVGSNATQLSVISRSGSAVTPTPNRHVISLTGSNLVESIFPATGGAAPSWIFSTTPTSTRTLLTNLTAPSGISFRYYDYVNGQLSTTPLPTPLSATSAARTAYVSITLTSAPSGGASSLDTKSPITISDSADLRLESAGQLTTQDNLPCM